LDREEHLCEGGSGCVALSKTYRGEGRGREEGEGGEGEGSKGERGRRGKREKGEEGK